MNLLITAGNTQVLIDKVRCLTNMFTGRTGAAIALAAHARGHHVDFLTSQPEAMGQLAPGNAPKDGAWRLFPYQTFEDLRRLMSDKIANGKYDIVIHAAAVSDYHAAGIFAPAPRSEFDSGDLTWRGAPPTLVDRGASKVKSDEPELWLRLTRAPKLVDSIRKDWGFTGILVKFKLEVGVSDERLLEIAEKSRRQSDADMMVANTLEEASQWAYVGPFAGAYRKVPRPELAARLLDALESHARDLSTPS